MMDRNRARAEDQTWYECDIAIWGTKNLHMLHAWLIDQYKRSPAEG